MTEYKCELCNYVCGNKKFNFDKHLKSKKHLKKINGEDDTSYRKRYDQNNKLRK